MCIRLFSFLFCELVMKCEQALALYSVGVLLVPFVIDLCFMP